MSGPVPKLFQPGNVLAFEVYLSLLWLWFVLTAKPWVDFELKVQYCRFVQFISEMFVPNTHGSCLYVRFFIARA